MLFFQNVTHVISFETIVILKINIKLLILQVN